MIQEWWRYDSLEPCTEYDWSPATRGNHEDDCLDFHLDLGAGTLRKARLTIDLRGNPDIRFDLDKGLLLDSKGPLEQVGNGLPFPDNSIENIVSHHCLEHIGDGFIPLMDQCYRVLKPGGIFRIIVPLFPSFAAVEDADHRRYFCKNTFECFVHEAPLDVPFWTEAFSAPYTSARFHLRHKDYTPPEKFTTPSLIDIDRLFEKGREIRVSLQKPQD